MTPDTAAIARAGSYPELCTTMQALKASQPALFYALLYATKKGLNIHGGLSDGEGFQKAPQTCESGGSISEVD